jgi:OAA-family lectin sugar binding domain
MALSPVFVDFSAASPSASGTGVVHSDGVVVRACGAAARPGYRSIGAGGWVEVDFQGAPQQDELTLKIVALVSRDGERVGCAPLDVRLNGHPVASGLRVPGGGDLPQTLCWSVRGDWLKREGNVLTVRSGTQSATMLWLYRILLESVWDRDKAELALLRRTDANEGSTYRTKRQPFGQPQWVDDASLTVQIAGQANPSSPVELAWRGRDGSEATVFFAAEMEEFSGLRRDADGQWTHFAGTRIEPAPTGEPALSGAFETETEWAGYWSRGPVLVLRLGFGLTDFESVQWRTRWGVRASIVIPNGGASFEGTVQNVNEGAIRYRGVRTAGGGWL